MEISNRAARLIIAAALITLAAALLAIVWGRV